MSWAKPLDGWPVASAVLVPFARLSPAYASLAVAVRSCASSSLQQLRPERFWFPQTAMPTSWPATSATVNLSNCREPRHHLVRFPSPRCACNQGNLNMTRQAASNAAALE